MVTSVRTHSTRETRRRDGTPIACVIHMHNKTSTDPGIPYPMTPPTAGPYASSEKDCCAREQYASEALQNLIGFHEQRLRELLALAQALPAQMAYPADGALRKTFQHELNDLQGR